jgi:hypothetical protein
VAPDLATFRALVATLQPVDVETWLAAMPASVVKPEGRSKVVLEPRFDIAPLLRAREDAVLDRYQLGAQVAGAVACAWLDQWVAVRREGDAGSLRQSVGALATSREWQVLLDMNAGAQRLRVAAGLRLGPRDRGRVVVAFSRCSTVTVGSCEGVVMTYGRMFWFSRRRCRGSQTRLSTPRRLHQPARRTGHDDSRRIS